MKQSCYILITVTLFLSYSTMAQQNLVPNGNFEHHTSCPTGHGQLPNYIPWYNYAASPDVFNTCGSGGVSVPTSIRGYQWAASGNGYMGFVTYQSGGHS